MAEGETSQEHDLYSPLGKLRLTWELFRPNFGSTIAIQTGETDCPMPELATSVWRCVPSCWAVLTLENEMRLIWLTPS